MQSRSRLIRKFLSWPLDACSDLLHYLSIIIIALSFATFPISGIFSLVILGALLMKTNSNGDIPSNAEDAKVFIAYAVVEANNGHCSPLSVSCLFIIFPIICICYSVFRLLWLYGLMIFCVHCNACNNKFIICPVKVLSLLTINKLGMPKMIFTLCIKASAIVLACVSFNGIAITKFVYSHLMISKNLKLSNPFGIYLMSANNCVIG